VATNSSIIDRVRLELGDQPSTFDVTVQGNGTAVRYETGTYPLDGASLTVTVNGTVNTACAVEERTGVVTFDAPPADGSAVRFKGTKYRYFGAVDLQKFIDSAIAEHTHNRTDAFGRQITIATMPGVEEYPLSLLGAIKALWALATDAAFDIDINAPDGVAIPRSERYRQLLEQIAALTEQYKDICSALNIGLWRIEVFNLRRVSKMSGRLIPVYIEREIDDNSPPQRAFLPTNTYGTEPFPMTYTEYDLKMTQGDAFSITLDFDFDLSIYNVKAQVRQFAQSQTIAAEFTVTVIDAGLGKVTLSLTSTQTARFPLKQVWDVQITNSSAPTDTHTALGGFVFTHPQVTQ